MSIGRTTFVDHIDFLIAAFVRASFLARQADVVAALTLECVFGTNKAFDQR